MPDEKRGEAAASGAISLLRSSLPSSAGGGVRRGGREGEGRKRRRRWWAQSVRAACTLYTKMKEGSVGRRIYVFTAPSLLPALAPYCDVLPLLLFPLPSFHLRRTCHAQGETTARLHGARSHIAKSSHPFHSFHPTSERAEAKARPPWLRFMLYRIIYERTDGRADVGAALIVRCSPRRLCAAPRLNFLLLSLLRRGGRRPTTATTSRSRRE